MSYSSGRMYTFKNENIETMVEQLQFRQPSTKHPVSKPLTMEQWYDSNLRDAIEANSNSCCKPDEFNRSKKPDYKNTEPYVRPIPNATYPLVITQTHKDSVRHEYNNLYTWDQKAVVAIIHAAKMGWTYTSFYLYESTGIPEVIKWHKMSDQVYRNIMAFFVCKGCCFAGIPVEKESEHVVSVTEASEDLDMDVKDEDEDEEGGVALTGCYDEDGNEEAWETFP